MKKHAAHVLWLWIICMPVGAQEQPPVAVACSVQGHDLILYNRTAEPMPPGVTIQWSAWNGRREGTHTLTEPLVPDIGLMLSSALGASYFWDRPCEAHVTPAQDEISRNGKIHLQGGQGNASVAKP